MNEVNVKRSAPLPLLVLPAVALSLLAGCSQVKKLNEMHDATQSMSATTTGLSTKTDGLNKLMGEIFDTGRQGGSVDFRGKSFDRIIGMPKLEDKIINSGLYFVALEFELWSAVGPDELVGERDKLAHDAADEFFCHLLSITHWDTVDAWAGTPLHNITDRDNERAAFNALAIVLAKTNRIGGYTSEVHQTDSLNMNKLIENALFAGKEIRDGKKKLSDYPSYVAVVLANEEHAIRILKARYQALGLVVLSELTSIGENDIEGLKYKVLGKQWNIDFSQINDARLEFYRSQLAEANRARDVLRQIGESVEIDPEVKKIYTHAQVQEQAAAATAESRADAAAFQQELQTYLN
jgi:hypothetical protein